MTDLFGPPSKRDDPRPAESTDLNRALWRSFVGHLTGFVREARRLLGMSEGCVCPRCKHHW